jgi:hypothetical protein
MHHCLHKWHWSGSVYSPAHNTDVSRIVGFDDLGNTDDFSTARLEYRLLETGII